MLKNRHLAPEKKYFRSKPAKKTTKVLLLLQDDKHKYLTGQQRSDLMADVGKQYDTAKKRQMIEDLPKYDIRNLPKGLSADDLIKAIKQKRVSGL